jgi:hypothetical protein
MAARAAAEAHTEAARRRAEVLAAGGDPDESLIEKIRPKLGSLDQILRSHGYDRRGNGTAAKYRHANSQSGSYGADVKTFGGIERVYSHNGGDPLHRDNLPTWCDGVTALDVVDVVIILEFAGDRDRALRELAQRCGLAKAAERKAIAVLLFRLIREQADQAAIEAAAFAEGDRLGLSRAEVCDVARYVAAQATMAEVA